MTPLDTHSRDSTVGREVLLMTSTAAVSLLALFLTDILTLAYVSQLGDEVATAAVGIGKTLSFVATILVTSVVLAAGSIISQRVGRGRQAILPVLALQSLGLAVGVAAVVIALGASLLDEVVAWLGPAAGVDADARHYLQITLLAVIPVAVTQATAQLLRAVGEPRRALIVVLTMALSLALIDPVMIFGFDLQLLGAGISSVVAGCLSGGFGLWQVQRRIGLRFGRRGRLLRRHVRRVAHIASPYALGHLATPVALGFTLSQLATFGVSVMAAMSLMDRLLQIVYCFYFALPTALVPVFSLLLGKHRRGDFRLALRRSVQLVLGYGVVAWGVLALSSPLLATLFSLSAAGEALLVDLCRYGLGFWLLIGLDFIAVSVFVSLERSWWVTLFAWARATLGTLPWVWLGGKFFGASGIMLGMWFGNALVAMVSIATACEIARRQGLFSRQTTA
ncbi:MATE family efflux transporter [Salinicola halophilus]|uniref:MATE family efflux transporter n=1 Tax=Salinicola halophilus TaxID=184065 RepID=UPI000DA1B9FB|nr:MATE family efflux transporter [Salinicola halophilus]